MENDGRVTVAELTDLLRRVAARWIPRLLTRNDKTKRVQL